MNKNINPAPLWLSKWHIVLVQFGTGLNFKGEQKEPTPLMSSPICYFYSYKQGYYCIMWGLYMTIQSNKWGEGETLIQTIWAQCFQTIYPCCFLSQESLIQVALSRSHFDPLYSPVLTGIFILFIYVHNGTWTTIHGPIDFHGWHVMDPQISDIVLSCVTVVCMIVAFVERDPWGLSSQFHQRPGVKYTIPGRWYSN